VKKNFPSLFVPVLIAVSEDQFQNKLNEVIMLNKYQKQSPWLFQRKIQKKSERKFIWNYKEKILSKCAALPILVQSLWMLENVKQRYEGE